MEQIVPSSEAQADRAEFDGSSERRAHTRLDIRLPVEILSIGDQPAAPIRATTRNVSSSGICFEAPEGVLKLGSHVHLSLSVPPGAGYFPYAVRGTAVAEVLRLNVLAAQGHDHPRLSAAARFNQPWKFVLPDGRTTAATPLFE